MISKLYPTKTNYNQSEGSCYEDTVNYTIENISPEVAAMIAQVERDTSKKMSNQKTLQILRQTQEQLHSNNSESK
jgi:hypothetical protein